MADQLTAWWVHDVTVERRTGTGAFGATFADATPLTGLVDGSSRLVRNSDGEEVVASVSVFLPAVTADIPVGSKVTLPAAFGGRTSHVIAAARHDAGSRPTPDHLELNLQ